MEVTKKDFNSRRKASCMYNIKRCGFLLFVSLLIPVLAFSQTKAVQGVVRDAQEEPIIGATVTVAGTKAATMTDVEGKFSIQAAATDKLIISYYRFFETGSQHW